MLLFISISYLLHCLKVAQMTAMENLLFSYFLIAEKSPHDLQTVNRFIIIQNIGMQHFGGQVEIFFSGFDHDRDV